MDFFAIRDDVRLAQSPLKVAIHVQIKWVNGATMYKQRVNKGWHID